MNQFAAAASVRATIPNQHIGASERSGGRPSGDAAMESERCVVSAGGKVGKDGREDGRGIPQRRRRKRRAVRFV